MEIATDKYATKEWLTDERWIILSFFPSFSEQLEQHYFTPSIPKNDELEIAVALASVNGLNGIAPFIRIKETTENRECLRGAMAEYTEEHLLTQAELDRNIQDSCRRIKATILPNLR